MHKNIFHSLQTVVSYLVKHIIIIMYIIITKLEYVEHYKHFDNIITFITNNENHI